MSAIFTLFVGGLLSFAGGPLYYASGIYSAASANENEPGRPRMATRLYNPDINRSGTSELPFARRDFCVALHRGFTAKHTRFC